MGRGWLALGLAGVLGSVAGVVLAGAITGWHGSGWAMAPLALAFAVILTMVLSVGIDLLAPAGSLPTGEQAGLFVVPHPVASIKARIQPFARYREVARLAAGNGLVHRPGARRHSAIGGREVQIRRTLEQAGGMFVKLGQVASTRTDLLPAALCAELSKLRTSAEPAPPELVRPAMEVALGAPVDAIFSHIDWTPLGSASIAQVYRAELVGGGPVVIKVRRPGLDELVARDAAALRQIAGVIEHRTPLGLSLRPLELASEFIDNLDEELDFTLEAANAQSLAAGTPAEFRTRVPRIYREHSSATLLVEEELEGVSIGDVAALDRMGIDRQDLADRLLRLMLHHIFEVGVFHGDPHPGNILVTADGGIGLIDLGAVGRMGPAEQGAVVDMMLAASQGDAALLGQALLSVTTVGAEVQLPLLEAALSEFLGHNLRAGAGISANTFQDLVIFVGDYGVRAPRWFVTLGRTLVTLEGTLRVVQPGFSLVDAAHQLAAARAGAAASVAGLQELATKELMTQLPRLRRLPSLVDGVLDQAVAGRLTTRVSLFSTERDVVVITRLVNRAALSLLAAAMGIGSALLLGAQVGPVVSGTAHLSDVLGYIGLAVSAVLALRVVATIVRDGQW